MPIGYLPQVEWSSEDSEKFREFLDSPTGQKLIPALARHRPGFLSVTAEQHASFAQSRDIAGFENALVALRYLGSPQVDNTKHDVTAGSSAYPDLDDDAQWQDSEIDQ